MSDTSDADSNNDYWLEYTNLQHVKHRLIEEYLKGWFPKLSWSGRILYLDTHAGRGSHRGGQAGSPIVALNTLIQHSARDHILRRCEAKFVLIEQDSNNLAALKSEIERLGPLPNNIKVHPTCGNSFEELQQLVTELKQNGNRIAPAFVFVDPYGFKVPGALLRDLMDSGRVELFINIIWRELNMAIVRPAGGLAQTLDMIFGGDSWRSAISSQDPDERAEQAIALLRSVTGAKWSTYIRMLGGNHATRYFLLHLTNHPDGRALMKDCLWKVCPSGGFYARRRDDPRQQFLISPEPDLNPLRAWVLRHLKERPKRWQELRQLLLEEIWREPQLNEIVRSLRNEGSICGEQFTGRFGPSANPLLRLI